MAPAPRPGRARLVFGVVALAGLIALGWFSGLGDLVRDQDEFRDRIDGWGAWGPILFVALFTLLVPVGVPGLVFVVPSIVIWSAPVAFTLSLIGGVTSSAVGIVFSRYVARQSFEHRLPPRFHRFDAILSRRGLWGVVVLRVFTYLNPAADWLVGLSSVPIGRVLLGTTIGLIVPTAFIVWVGAEAVDFFFDSTLGIAILVTVAVAGAAAIWWTLQRRRRMARA